MNIEIVQALQKIKKLPDGEAIFNNPNRFKGIIGDLLPGSGRDMVRMRKRTAEAAELGIYARLSKAVTVNELHLTAQSMVEQMRDTGLDENVAKEIVGSFMVLFTSEPIFNNP